ncbi:MAG: copper chaperone CopZ [Bacillota bacterium]|uniref:Copper chaperone CopZ n=1 Tax=Virgibacillus salarius TaxID=447199 RepID=A0A941IB16_9BACI|nr:MULTISPECIES: copper chaperone CopZ [Bacillaceae]NAZ09963.1 copper chaperone CopZ [Agaribacter marinus]MBR7797253.1 copper chaperone CopZ [Virgibacillus salarius]MCC2251613.1 copper chaperone CopZ [Virgibacillus sp. AGTR]MDY7045910.1 copper chaperone CopZ [Virgibacillus sp. M23]QRZ19623.1 copper chaperone CopZ [Virgibacillus sp. AGTR]
MQTTIDVKGMSCGHCEQSVKGALENLTGVTTVEVHLNTGKVDITYDDTKVSIADMQEVIEEQGYDVIV